MISFLAVAGIFGVTSALINKQVEDTPVVEKAEAYDTTSVSVAGSWNSWSTTADPMTLIGDYWTFSREFTADETFKVVINGSEWVGDGDGISWCEDGGMGSKGKLQDFKVLTTGSYIIKAAKTIGDYGDKSYGIQFRNAYTINFYPNGGTGSNATRFKEKGVAYTIPDYSDVGIGASGGRHTVKWSTNSAGTETDYQPGDSYDTDSSLSLFLIEDWYTYQFSVNGGSWNTLNKTESTPDGYVAQFATTEAYSFTSGDTVTFQRYYGDETPTSITPSSYEENINSSGVIYYSASGNIYLKVTDGNGHTVYVEGFAHKGIVVIRGGHNYKCGCSEDSSTQWHVNNITLLPGDTLAATDEGGDPYEVYVENIDLYGITRAGVVSTPGVYNIYLKKNEFSEWKNIYLSMDDAATAKLIAQQFNKDLATVCASTVKGGATSQITSAFSTHSNYYNHLTELCQAAVKSTSTDTDVVAMRAKYDYIVGKYGTTIAPDYLGRNPAPVGAIKTFSQFSLFDNPEENLSTIIIIAASSIALISIASLSILIIKKKKSKE